MLQSAILHETSLDICIAQLPPCQLNEKYTLNSHTHLPPAEPEQKVFIPFCGPLFELGFVKHHLRSLCCWYPSKFRPGTGNSSLPVDRSCSINYRVKVAGFTLPRVPGNCTLLQLHWASGQQQQLWVHQYHGSEAIMQSRFRVFYKFAEP